MNTFQRVSSTIMLTVLAAAMLTCGAQLSHGKTSLPSGEPLAAIAGYQRNPFIYNVGAVTAATPIDGNLLVTFAPMATYQEFSEKIQFCGSPIAMFDNKKNPVVLTYTRQAYRIIEGRGCHELFRVDNVSAQ